uniref:COP9 signalosome complex subunit 2 n=1 Tax=Peronospora matthiolae TaxID=2874970 RepID=A0AAV1VFG2_9STRA
MSDSEEYEYEYDSDEELDHDEQTSTGAAKDEENEGAGEQQRRVARDAQIALENTFYEAEDFYHRGDWTQAFTYFERVIAMERETRQQKECKWSFPALEQLVKICVRRCEWDEMLRHYEQMLEHLAFVTRNESTGVDLVYLGCCIGRIRQRTERRGQVYVENVRVDAGEAQGRE